MGIIYPAPGISNNPFSFHSMEQPFYRIILYLYGITHLRTWEQKTPHRKGIWGHTASMSGATTIQAWHVHHANVGRRDDGVVEGFDGLEGANEVALDRAHGGRGIAARVVGRCTCRAEKSIMLVNESIARDASNPFYAGFETCFGSNFARLGTREAMSADGGCHRGCRRGCRLDAAVDAAQARARAAAPGKAPPCFEGRNLVRLGLSVGNEVACIKHGRVLAFFACKAGTRGWRREQ